MWAILAVSIQMLTGPNVWPVSDEGTFETEAECQAVLDELVPRTLSEELRIAWEEGQLKYVCLKVRPLGRTPN
ncbi:hypothetical protein [uncultured Roseibium sp.]|uniref:hypothetical protein n=1 Tax=uncultured Roseibium sp. TaxID=1936171 RepID=UPI0026096609|nr:hypothetical protein [uncultured Roseibium sp.]